MITYRTSGPWGAGKGGNLTYTELDTNFYTLMQGIEELTAGLSSAAEIAGFTAIGGNLYVQMTDGGEFGPYPLPVAKWRARGEWTPTTSYAALDFFTYNGAAYLVNIAHTSAATFDPYRNDGLGHDYYSLLFEPPTRYMTIACFASGTVGNNETLFLYPVTNSFTIPEDLIGSRFASGTAPSDEVTYALRRNGTTFATVTFLPSGSPIVLALFGTTFAPGDVLSIDGPAVGDMTHANIGFAIRAILS